MPSQSVKRHRKIKIFLNDHKYCREQEDIPPTDFKTFSTKTRPSPIQSMDYSKTF